MPPSLSLSLILRKSLAIIKSVCQCLCVRAGVHRAFQEENKGWSTTTGIAGACRHVCMCALLFLSPSRRLVTNKLEARAGRGGGASERANHIDAAGEESARGVALQHVSHLELHYNRCCRRVLGSGAFFASPPPPCASLSTDRATIGPACGAAPAVLQRTAVVLCALRSSHLYPQTCEALGIHTYTSD